MRPHGGHSRRPAGRPAGRWPAASGDTRPAAASLLRRARPGRGGPAGELHVRGRVRRSLRVRLVHLPWSDRGQTARSNLDRGQTARSNLDRGQTARSNLDRGQTARSNLDRGLTAARPWSKADEGGSNLEVGVVGHGPELVARDGEEGQGGQLRERRRNVALPAAVLTVVNGLFDHGSNRGQIVVASSESDAAM